MTGQSKGDQWGSDVFGEEIYKGTLFLHPVFFFVPSKRYGCRDFTSTRINVTPLTLTACILKMRGTPSSLPPNISPKNRDYCGISCERRFLIKVNWRFKELCRLTITELKKRYVNCHNPLETMSIVTLSLQRLW